jgi:hypothetical protein
MLTLDFVASAHYLWSDEERELIREIAEQADRDIRARLSELADVTVHVKAAQHPFDVIPDTGDGGGSTAPGHVNWAVDADRPGGVAAVTMARLRPTLFHEFHHQVRGWVMSDSTALLSDTFMNAPVSEGLATAFERDESGVAPPWSEYPENVADWLQELLTEFTEATYAQWMFFHPDGRRLIGYKAGTYLADRAMSASGRSAADLVRVPAREIMGMAGYPLPG